MKQKTNPLQHKIEIKKDDVLHVSIETKRLIIRSLMTNDERDYVRLLGDADVMKKFAAGVAYSEDKAKAAFKIAIEKWAAHNPYSAYAIFEKSSKNFIGFLNIRVVAAGECKAAYIYHKNSWGNGYGTEAAKAIFQSLVPKLISHNYKSYHKPLKKIVATARVDNLPSQKILTGVGFKEQGTVFEDGAQRFLYHFFAKQALHQYEGYYKKERLKIHRKDKSRMINEDVDVTAQEMANSPFGKESIMKLSHRALK